LAKNSAKNSTWVVRVARRERWGAGLAVHRLPWAFAAYIRRKKLSKRISPAEERADIADAGKKYYITGSSCELF
jgi:hypothetical protein